MSFQTGSAKGSVLTVGRAGRKLSGMPPAGWKWPDRRDSWGRGGGCSPDGLAHVSWGQCILKLVISGRERNSAELGPGRQPEGSRGRLSGLQPLAWPAGGF